MNYTSSQRKTHVLMKTSRIFVVSACVVLCTASVPLRSQTFTVLHHFSLTSGYPYTNWDGADLYHAGVALSGETLFGRTYAGGTNANGTVFSLSRLF